MAGSWGRWKWGRWKWGSRRKGQAGAAGRRRSCKCPRRGAWPHSQPPTALLPCAATTLLQSTSSKQQSVADLVLEGHTQNAEFAVGISSAAPLVASGGKDKKVGCLAVGWMRTAGWCLQSQHCAHLHCMHACICTQACMRQPAQPLMFNHCYTH